MRITQNESPGIAAAQQVAALVRANNARGRPTVLALPTGNTPVPMYDELVRMHREEGLDFSKVVTFNLDEYWPLKRGDQDSYHTYMQKHFFSQVNIAPKNIHIPDCECSIAWLDQHLKDYDAAIAKAGGIDLLIAGIGRNGHLAFNEPGAMLKSRVRMVTLADETCEVNGVERGQMALTMGLANIKEAKHVLVLATGEGKAAPVKTMLSATRFNRDCPATMLCMHPAVQLIADEQALSQSRDIVQRAQDGARRA